MIYDDRPKVSPGVKFKDAELIGVPTIVTVGRGLADGNVEVKDRRSGERTEVPVDGAVDHLTALVRDLRAVDAGAAPAYTAGTTTKGSRHESSSSPPLRHRGRLRADAVLSRCADPALGRRRCGW